MRDIIITTTAIIIVIIIIITIIIFISILLIFFVLIKKITKRYQHWHNFGLSLMIKKVLGSTDPFLLHPP